MNKLKLQLIWKRNKLKTKYHTKIYDLKCWILKNIIGNDDIIEYCIDLDLLHDYYNEEPEHDDYWQDLD